MFKSKLQFWTFEILLIVLIIFVSTQISFIFKPVGTFVSTLFFPVLISGFLYFLFIPIVRLLEKIKIPKALAIIILYAIFVGLVTLLGALVGPALSKQVTDLADNMPQYVDQIRTLVNDLSNSKGFKWLVTQDYVSIEKVENSLVDFFSNFTKNITSSLATIFGVITNITLTIVTVPFILFYMLKDGHKFPKALIRFLPQSYRKQGLTIIDDTGETLATYIQGQIIVCIFVGVCTYIGYLIIGLPYGLVLAILGAITNIIPYVGPFIGAAPAVVIGLFGSPTLAILVIVVIVVVQQLDGNFISPLVIGKRLDLHPLTIIIILLVAGNLAGILGMILGVPVYAVSKTIVLNIAKFVKLRSQYKKGLRNEDIEL
ncbi:AI-2E family transporter [Priestia koreensis]|uniref:AI-2E family transporter n=1 Tax=Priestia koreensis TaxID=284581 RepID=A0A0M0L8A7_9BACI|nr:AI-2E family transporter [Priestia koreensis]KOO47082.1 hypothetical protein AMD01_06915 [Priestia koreensis]